MNHPTGIYTQRSRGHHSSSSSSGPLQVEASAGRGLAEERNDPLNVVEAELIDVLAGRNNPKIISQRILLEKLFGEILQVSF